MPIGCVGPDTCWEQVVACTTFKRYSRYRTTKYKICGHLTIYTQGSSSRTGGQSGCCVSYADDVIEVFSQEPFDLLYWVCVSSVFT